MGAIVIGVVLALVVDEDVTVVETVGGVPEGGYSVDPFDVVGIEGVVTDVVRIEGVVTDVVGIEGVVTDVV